MKRLQMFVALVSIPGAVMAQSLGFGVHGNFTLSNLPGPTVEGSRSLQDAYGTGIGGGAHLDVSLVMVSFRLSGDYMKYSLDEEKFRSFYADVFGGAVSQIAVDGGGLSIFSLSANGKMNILPLPIVTPYLTGGVGLAWLSTDEAKTSIAGVAGRTFPSSSSGGKTSLNLGVGADINLGVALFVEAKYVWILTDGGKSSYVPVTIGVTF